MYKQLAKENSSAFNPFLALSLYNYSTVLSVMGSRDDALDIIEEAVAIWKDLATENPEVFKEYLAKALGWLSELESNAA